MYTLMLLSGGGNDLLNSGKLYTMLNNYTGGQTPKQLINMPVAQAEMAKIMCLFDYIVFSIESPRPPLRSDRGGSRVSLLTGEHALDFLDVVGEVVRIKG
jgi:hypothetical protein